MEIETQNVELTLGALVCGVDHLSLTVETERRELYLCRDCFYSLLAPKSPHLRPKPAHFLPFNVVIERTGDETMIWRASALVSPGFKKRKIPRSELLDPPPRRTRWWVWMLLVVMLTGGSLIALSAIAAEPGEASAGELMFRTAGGGHASAIHLGTNVDITITGIVARTTLVQSFKNSTDEWQEAIYVFPLPGEAAVNFMEMRIGDRVITAEIREREAAKKIYERAKREGKKAALTEQERPNLFTQSVANIAPGETVEVTLRYIETARFDGGTFSLRVPMTLTPRYVPGQPGQSERKGTGWGAPTNEVPDAGRITPPMSHAAARGATIDVSLEAGLDLVSITSDCHRIVPERQGDVHDIRLADGRVPMDRDFVLRWTPVASDVPTATFFRESVGGKDYGLLMVLPPKGEGATPAPRRDLRHRYLRFHER
ncbi:MAG: VIT domain-containing protein [Gammaproteobacteria bacterium]|nr:VIT domain-containing protein [Gammaproteobacteria bacterium]